jgi:hypothetical protein
MVEFICCSPTVGPMPTFGQSELADVREPGGQDPGLAGAGACEHQHRTVGREHRVPLLLVQTLEIRRVALGRGRSPPVAKGGGERVMVNEPLSVLSFVVPESCRSR